jgi:hypothetical protein
MNRPARLLLLGASVRAMAESAATSGLTRQRFPGGLIALDYFGDTDLEAGSAREAWPMEVLSVARDLGLPRTTAGLGRGALALSWSAVAIAGGLENRPALLRLLARRGRLLGHAPGSIAAVRDEGQLFPFLAGRGLPHAAVRCGDVAPAGCGEWLFKRRRSAGGGGVRRALPGGRRRPGEYLQERIDGPVGSAAFAAGAGRAAIVGISEQIDGAAWPGAGPFRYAGNIVGPRGALLAAEAETVLARTLAAIASRFDLGGLGGADFIVDGGLPRIIEINPRWTASMELFEAGRPGEDRSLFDLHLAALEGDPEKPIPTRGGAGDPWVAKAILYALEDCLAPEPEALAMLGARDRPRARDRFAPGQPICTLFASGGGRTACLAALEARATEARRLLERATRAHRPAGGIVVSSDRPVTAARRERWPQPARPW